MFLIFFQIMAIVVYQILRLNFLAVLTIAHFCAFQFSIFQAFTPVSIAASFATQIVNSMMDSGVGSNFVMTASCSPISNHTVLDQVTSVMTYVLTYIRELCSVHAELFHALLHAWMASSAIQTSF